MSKFMPNFYFHFSRYLTNTSLLLSPDFPASPPTQAQCPHLKHLVFTSTQRPVHAFLPHTIHYIPETIAHMKIRLRKHSGKTEATPRSPKKSPMSPPGSPNKLPLSPTRVR